MPHCGQCRNVGRAGKQGIGDGLATLLRVYRSRSFMKTSQARAPARSVMVTTAACFGMTMSSKVRCAKAQAWISPRQMRSVSYDVPLTGSLSVIVRRIKEVDATIDRRLDQFIGPSLVNGADGLEEPSAIHVMVPRTEFREQSFETRRPVLPSVAYSMMSSNWQRSGFGANPTATPTLRPKGHPTRIDHP